MTPREFNAACDLAISDLVHDLTTPDGKRLRIVRVSARTGSRWDVAFTVQMRPNWSARINRRRAAAEWRETRPCLHFVGIRLGHVANARQIWGWADYIHPAMDAKAMGEIADGDIVIKG